MSSPSRPSDLHDVTDVKAESLTDLCVAQSDQGRLGASLQRLTGISVKITCRIFGIKVTCPKSLFRKKHVHLILG